MDYQYLRFAVDGAVVTVTIHRPDKGNALAPQVLEELEHVFLSVARREDIRVVVLTGGEKYFSAGFDLNEIRRLDKVSNEAYTAMFHGQSCSATSRSSALWAARRSPAVSISP
jgi:enoyl-CoA hydratase/carnithine racemase